MTTEDPRLSFHRFFYKCRATQSYQQSTASIDVFSFQKLPKFSIGRSWNSCTERPERQLHSWTAMFTTKHFRRPSLYETISHLCLQKTRHARFLHLRLCLYNQLTCQFLAKTSMFFCYGTYRRARTFAHTLTEYLSKREKCSTSRLGAGASYQTSHPGISVRAIAFGHSWPFAAFCYRPRLPVRHWGRAMSAPKPH